MPENPKAKEKKIRDGEEASSSEETGASSYYYDDAHGYEDYDKDKEKDEEDNALDD